jgi:hypothetical protein
MSNKEGQNLILLSESQKFAESSGHPKPDCRKYSFVPSNFPCIFVHACEICDGVLAPSVMHIVCKKASVRGCFYFQRKTIPDTHLSCNTMVVFARNIPHYKINKKVNP